MNDVLIASDQADATAAEQVVAHHAELSGTITALVAVLTRTTDGDEAHAAREKLVSWARTELLPHAAAEEKAMYAAAAELPELRLLVQAMLAEHRTLTGLVDALAAAEQPATAVAAAGGLEAVFGTHLQKENELLLPALVAAPGVSLAGMLAGMHEVLGGHAAGEGESDASAAGAAATAGGCGGHSCACGEVDGSGFPELDARTVPHAIRHATIFGALDTVAPGGGLVLVAPHDPLPLLAQLQDRHPDRFEVSYLERGPEAWRLQLVRP